jgi:RNA polymerase sigma-70 factor (TIGR02957 family)
VTETDRVETFEGERRRLFGLAYRMLGSAGEAEDVVQEAYLRWHNADDVDNPPAWLAKVTTNLCLTRLTSARARREVYVGPWLPEPVLTEGVDALGPLESAEQRDSVSFALLTLMERLTPAERAVFVLREAFAYSFREIGEVLDQAEANCRQLYHRGKQRLEDARPRYEVSREEGRRVVGRFLAAAQLGDLEELEQLLLADVVSWSDGGGKITAARRPVVGRERVATYVTAPSRNKRFFDPVLELFGGPITMRSVEVNGDPALIVFAAEHPVAVLVVELAADGIAGLRTVVNPDKLVFLGEQLSRMETLPGSSF